MSSEFSVRWKGALYGIDYNTWRGSTQISSASNLKPIPSKRAGRSLVNICCKEIVKDATFAKAAVALVPHELLYSLMKEAIEQGRHCTVKVLLEAWPSRSLCVNVLTPYYHRSGQLLYDRLLYSIKLEEAVRLTSLLIHTFIQLAQQAPDHHPGKLKVLDLSGFPVVEPVLQLVSHTIAERHFHYECPAQKHSQQPCLTAQIIASDKSNSNQPCDLSISSTCEKAEASSNEGNTPPISVETLRKGSKRQRNNGNSPRKKGCTCDPYIIRMDCFIRDEIILDELCRALRACQSSTPHLKLQVSKVDAVCLGERPLMGLLKLLDAEFLTGLGLEYNGFCNEGVIHMSPQISSFGNMTALDLSCNNINMPKNAQVCIALGKTLESLKKLTRLDLSNNKLSGCLAALLSRVSHHSAASFTSSHSLQSINHGDITGFLKGVSSKFVFEENSQAITPMLQGRRGLEYLKLSACQLKEEDVEYLATCSHISGVIELDLSENFFATRTQGLIRLLETLRNSLQVLELEDCGFKGAQLALLVSSLGRLWGLRYLNMARNFLTTEDLCQWLPSLRALPHLECIRLSSAYDWIDHSSNNEALYGSERGKRRRVEKAVQEKMSSSSIGLQALEGVINHSSTKATGSSTTHQFPLGLNAGKAPVIVVWEDHCLDE